MSVSGWCVIKVLWYFGEERYNILVQSVVLTIKFVPLLFCVYFTFTHPRRGLF